MKNLSLLYMILMLLMILIKVKLLIMFMSSLSLSTMTTRPSELWCFLEQACGPQSEHTHVVHVGELVPAGATLLTPVMKYSIIR